MAKVVAYSQALKGLFFMLAAVLLLIFGGQWAEHLTHDPHAAWWIRAFGVVVAIASMIPWLLIFVFAIGAGDEYVRQVAIVGTAIAFVADLLVHVGFDVAQDARLISWNTHLLPLPLAMGLWLLGVSLAALYYRYRA